MMPRRPSAPPVPAATLLADGAELRARIAGLRQELAVTTQSYQAARRTRRGDEVVTLLRKRSEVLQQLFQAQRELILQLRTELQSEPPENM